MQKFVSACTATVIGI